MNGLQQAADSYFPTGTALSISPLGEGHIHDSYVLRAGLGEPSQRLVLQRINRSVFPDPQGLVRTISRVTEHLRSKALASGRDAERQVLRLAPTRDGSLLAGDSDGEVWRAYAMIERAAPAAYPQSPAEAHAIGSAFGLFLRDLSDFPLAEIEASLPNLHDAGHHLKLLDDARREDPLHRLGDVAEELTLIDGRREDAEALLAGMPRRAIHADTKINNVLLDDATGQGLCVIDLDTVMGGTSAIDIGNFLRSVLRRSHSVEHASSEPGLAFFEAGLRGYRKGVGDLLDGAEWAAVLDALLQTAVVLAVRFLADYLAGDRYFRVTQGRDNLRRCREQLAVVTWVESYRAELQDLVLRVVGSEVDAEP
ncbi:aminoglycoside phosphotransferase family protein [Candidatus Bipolaricaulota bacterium]|nr:aminoglycoside phosphotransferase family protein [Candidatus Bipolaricaulota bacterium]